MTKIITDPAETPAAKPPESQAIWWLNQLVHRHGADGRVIIEFQLHGDVPDNHQVDRFVGKHVLQPEEMKAIGLSPDAGNIEFQFPIKNAADVRDAWMRWLVSRRPAVKEVQDQVLEQMRAQRNQIVTPGTIVPGPGNRMS